MSVFHIFCVFPFPEDESSMNGRTQLFPHQPDLQFATWATDDMDIEIHEVGTTVGKILRKKDAGSYTFLSLEAPGYCTVVGSQKWRLESLPDRCRPELEKAVRAL